MKQHNYRSYVAVGIGGTLGTLLRYVSSKALGFIAFPVETIVVNLLGSFLLAYLTFHPKIKNRLSPLVFTAFTTGLLGSFTTFSTLILDSYLLLSETGTLLFGYLGIQMIGGLLCCLIGAKTAMVKELQS